MAAYAGVASLMNNIEQIMSHPRLSTSLNNEQMDSLHRKASDLLEFIKTGTNVYGGVINEEVEDLERQIARAAHAAEDEIESHIVDQIHRPTNLRCSLDLQKAIQEMDAAVEKAAEVDKKRRLSEKQRKQTSVGVGAPEGKVEEVEEEEVQLTTTRETSSPVGLEGDVIRLMECLALHQTNRRTISIVGMGGSVKTTLTQNLYGHPPIKEHFDIRAWATVSQKNNFKEILSQLLSSIGKFAEKGLNDLGLVLHKTLSKRRYLIVLDDIWSVEAWDEVRRFFPNDGNGSRIVLTTRLSDVASDCGSRFCFTMKPLDEDKSWELFCKKAFEQENCPYPKLEKVGKEIARLCKGLPLSIVVIGGILLKSPRTLKFWGNVAFSIRSNPNSKEKQESLDVLALSYNHLPPHLKPCFLYMGVFEEDSEIRVSKISKLWVGEGFIRPNGIQGLLEEIAEDCLQDLISRNLVLVEKYRRNGKIGTCRVHDLVRDMCLNLAQQQHLYHVVPSGTERRLLCDHLEGANPLLRSITTHGAADLERYRLIRVFVGGVCDTTQRQLYGSVNLRHLSYYLTCTPELPPSISWIWNLQTLIIAPASPLHIVVVPIEIWKMRNLRRVKCLRLHFPSPPHAIHEQDRMGSLQMLTTAVNLGLSEEVCGIIPNVRKLALSYDLYFHGYDESAVECLCNLDRLHKLETLNLSAKGNNWSSPNTRMIEKLAFPSSLKKLSLSCCQLHWGDMAILGSLPQLQVLKLLLLSVTEGREWIPVEGQFLRLKFLEIVGCNLHVWEAESSHFPVLEKLAVSRLLRLKEIPLSMGEIPTLELIRVDSCSESASISALRIKEEQMEDMGNDVLQVQVGISDWKLDRFMERMEAEGINIDRIEISSTSQVLYTNVY